MDNSAVKPNFYNDFQSLEVFKEADNKEKPDDETIALANLAKHKGWKILARYIGEINEELDNMIAQAMAQGATYEEIGQKTIVKDLAKYAIRRITERVEDSRRTVEQS